MVREGFKTFFLSRQTGKQGVLSLVMLSLLIKPLGFLREILVAYFFGATSAMDAFVVANTLYVLAVGLALSALPAAGVPILVESGEKKREVLLGFSTATSLFALGITVFLLLGAPTFVYLLAPKLSPSTRALAAQLVWVMAPMGLGIVWLALATAFYTSERRFSFAKLGAGLVNLVTILFLFSAPFLGIYSLAIGWSLGYLLAGAGLLIPVLAGVKSKRNSWRNREVKALLKLSLPILVAYAASQINIAVDRAFASTLPEGSISSLNYAWKLLMFTSVFLGAVGTVQLTRASEMASVGQLSRLKKDVSRLIIKIALVAVPLSLILLIFGEPLVKLIYQRGAFTAAASESTAAALAFYGLGLFPMGCVFLLEATFRGMKDTKTPAASSVAAIAVNVLLNFLLVRRMGVAGLALASSVAAAVNAGIMGGLIWIKARRE